MNSNDLADHVAGIAGTTKAEARRIVDGIFTAMLDAAKKGDEVSINGFGKFKVKQSAAREGRNPSTGAVMNIPASKKLGYAPSKAVKDMLNG